MCDCNWQVVYGVAYPKNDFDFESDTHVIIEYESEHNFVWYPEECSCALGFKVDGFEVTAKAEANVAALLDYLYPKPVVAFTWTGPGEYQLRWIFPRVFNDWSRKTPKTLRKVHCFLSDRADYIFSGLYRLDKEEKRYSNAKSFEFYCFAYDNLPVDEETKFAYGFLQPEDVFKKKFVGSKTVELDMSAEERQADWKWVYDITRDDMIIPKLMVARDCPGSCGAEEDLPHEEDEDTASFVKKAVSKWISRQIFKTTLMPCGMHHIHI